MGDGSSQCTVRGMKITTDGTEQRLRRTKTETSRSGSRQRDCEVYGQIGRHASRRREDVRCFHSGKSRPIRSSSPNRSPTSIFDGGEDEDDDLLDVFTDVAAAKFEEKRT